MNTQHVGVVLPTSGSRYDPLIELFDSIEERGTTPISYFASSSVRPYSELLAGRYTGVNHPEFAQRMRRCDTLVWFDVRPAWQSFVNRRAKQWYWATKERFQTNQLESAAQLGFRGVVTHRRDLATIISNMNAPLPVRLIPWCSQPLQVVNNFDPTPHRIWLHTSQHNLSPPIVASLTTAILERSDKTIVRVTTDQAVSKALHCVLKPITKQFPNRLRFKLHSKRAVRNLALTTASWVILDQIEDEFGHLAHLAVVNNRPVCVYDFYPFNEIVTDDRQGCRIRCQGRLVTCTGVEYAIPSVWHTVDYVLREMGRKRSKHHDGDTQGALSRYQAFVAALTDALEL